jgi:hypothetical protein
MMIGRLKNNRIKVIFLLVAFFVVILFIISYFIANQLRHGLFVEGDPRICFLKIDIKKPQAGMA